MTENQHGILYNAGMNLLCDNDGGVHLCPDVPTYQYVMYLVESKKKKGSIKLRLKKETGECEITGVINVQKCQKYFAEHRVKMTDMLLKKEEIENGMKELRANGEIADAVFAVTLEKTRMLKKEQSEGDIRMMDFAGVFDENALLTYFVSLFQCLLQEIREDRTGVNIIEKFAGVLKACEEVFQNNETVLRQIKNYFELTIKGLEKIGSVGNDILLITEKTKIVISNKFSAEDGLSFLFSNDINKELFQKWATILYAFLESYAAGNEKIREVAGEVRGALEEYVIKDMNLNKIRGLDKVNLKSKAALKANAKLIKDCLQNDIKLNGELKMFELIA